MRKLSQPRVNELRDILDKSLLTATGYEITTGVKDSLVQIACKDIRKYNISFSPTEKKLPAFLELQRTLDQKERETVYSVKLTPGYLLESEEEVVESFKDFLTLVGLWAARIDAEIRHPASLNEARQKFEKELNEKIDSAVKDDAATFSQEEKEHIFAMLRELSEKCAALEAEKKISAQEFKEINATCEDMAKAVDTLPKKAWLRTMTSRMYVTGKKALFSKVGKTLLIEAGKKLIDDAGTWLAKL